MFNKFALAAVAVVVVHDLQTQIKAYKAAKLYMAAHEAYAETEAANHAQIAYLVHLLETNNIAPTEFDLLALRFHGE